MQTNTPHEHLHYTFTNCLNVPETDSHLSKCAHAPSLSWNSLWRAKFSLLLHSAHTNTAHHPHELHNSQTHISAQNRRRVGGRERQRRNQGMTEEDPPRHTHCQCSRFTGLVIIERAKLGIWLWLAFVSQPASQPTRPAKRTLTHLPISFCSNSNTHSPAPPKLPLLGPHIDRVLHELSTARKWREKGVALQGVQLRIKSEMSFF